MKQYKELVKKVLAEGEVRLDRTGVGTKSIFGGMVEFDLRESFPLVTLKETRWKVAFLEMLWFLRGESHISYLHKHGSKLWDDWADAHGNVGPIYGVNWRGWPASGHLGPHLVDQVAELIANLQKSPHGRRHIVTAWNVSALETMALPPCHWAHQCYVSNAGYLDMQVNQRSWDLALGAPFNIAGYALLLHLYARATNLKPRMLKFSYGDAHVYTNHIEAMAAVVEREVISCNPKLVISTDNTDIDGYKPEDFSITGYEYGPFVKLPVAV